MSCAAHSCIVARRSTYPSGCRDAPRCTCICHCRHVSLSYVIPHSPPVDSIQRILCHTFPFHSIASIPYLCVRGFPASRSPGFALLLSYYNFPTLNYSSSKKGSPPLARERPVEDAHVDVRWGITPACAGKTKTCHD